MERQFMAKYIEVELVKIEEDRVVVLNGEEYLLLGELSKPRYKQEEAKKPSPKPKSKPKKRVTLGQIQPAVIKILGERPGLKNNELRRQVLKEYKLDPADSSFRSMLRRMKENGLIEVEGIKNGAKWSLKKQEMASNPLSEIRGPEEHIEF
jgi:hypothetical protein